MKRRLSILFAAILLFSYVFTGSILVGAEQSGAFEYFVTDYDSVKVATISYYNGPGGNIIIPSTLDGYPVHIIGAYSFEARTSISSVVFPESVTSISQNAFSGCKNLKNVTFGNKIKNISSKAFFECDGLTAVTLPASLKTFDITAFWGCEKLASISVEAGNPYFYSQNGVLFNGDATKLIQFPFGKTGIYTVPGSVSSIGEYAFYKTYGITSLTVSSGVNSIGSHAFNYCGMSSVSLSSGVGTISDFAFAQAKNLISISISGNVGVIRGYAFNGCKSLAGAIFNGNAPVMGPDVFARCAPSFKVYYNAGSEGFTSPWRGYKTTTDTFVPPTPAPTTVHPTSVKINKSIVILVKGKTTTLIASVSPANANNKKVTWKSSNSKCAKITSTGLVLGLSKGIAIITATTLDGAKSATCKVVVN